MLNSSQDVILSVIIPVGGDRVICSETLRTCLMLDEDGVEYVFVLDGNNARNLLEVNEFLCAVVRARFQLLKNDVSLGVGVARNMACSAAKGRYIGFLDSDDFLHGDAPKIFAMLRDCPEFSDVDILEVRSVLFDRHGRRRVISSGLEPGLTSTVSDCKLSLFEAFSWQSWLRIIRRELITCDFFGSYRCYEDIYGFSALYSSPLNSHLSIRAVEKCWVVHVESSNSITAGSRLSRSVILREIAERHSIAGGLGEFFSLRLQRVALELASVPKVRTFSRTKFLILLFGSENFRKAINIRDVFFMVSPGLYRGFYVATQFILRVFRKVI